VSKEVMGSRRLRGKRERAAEYHIGADSRDRLAITDQFEIPERIADIADQNRAGQPAVGIVRSAGPPPSPARERTLLREPEGLDTVARPD